MFACVTYSVAIQSNVGRFLAFISDILSPRNIRRFFYKVRINLGNYLEIAFVKALRHFVRPIKSTYMLHILVWHPRARIPASLLNGYVCVRPVISVHIDKIT